MKESPKARTAFLSYLVLRSSDTEPATTLVPRPSDTKPTTTLVLTDRQVARARDRLATQLKRLNDPQILVLDLAGITLTPSTMQELILPLAQRIRGGEYGTVRLVISTADPGVADFLRYMAQAHRLPLYLCHSPFDHHQATPIGSLTKTASNTLDTIIMLGGQVTASMLAEAEGIKPTAAINRLVNLDRDGYLIRQPRGHREGDVYIEPRSATSTPMATSTPTVFKEWY